MKKFKFKLDPLLRYRAFQERQQKMAVAAAHAAVVDCETRIRSMIQEMRKTKITFDVRLTTGMNAEQIRWFDHYLNALAAQRVSEEARRETLVTELIHQQQKLSEKTVLKKVVENLKERKKEAYYHQAYRTEQQMLDDLVILRSSRGANG
ncbi:MAG: flagellar export protein FliJ [Desulfobacterales bacterium]|jgi:flagellar export protein FliJ|nr:flagellar export protein FliJ [Desulfobacterales bacterium]